MRFFGRGDGARSSELYARYGPAIYARCKQMMKDRAAAEDLTQETFLAAHRTLARLRDERQALAWLYRIATNRCLNALRSGRRHPLAAEPAPDHAGADVSPHDQLIDRDLVVRLAREQPAAVAAVAWLYHVDGHDQAEVAEICGVSRRTVVARLGRFGERARAFLERSEREHDR